MKITIENHTAFCAPSGLVLNRVTLGMLRRRLKKESVHISQKQLLLCAKEIKRYKKDHSDWNLVEVFTKEGKAIKIKI